MLGTELPKSQVGDGSCVNYHKLKSKSKSSLRIFAHSLLDTFICPPIQRLQQIYTAAIGHNSQIIDSLDHQLLGTPRAALLLTNTGLHWAATTMKIRTTLVTGVTLVAKAILERRTVNIINCMSEVAAGLFSHLTDYSEKPHRIPRAPYRFIETYIAGIEYRNLVGGLV